MKLNEFRDYVSYDPETGLMYWIKSRSNRALVGSRFGANKDSKGYYRSVWEGKQYRTHRLAWFHYYGEMPNGVIDHINRNKLDNRINNLRIADATLNARNASISKNNTSGHVGVTWHKGAGKWIAQINVNRKNIYLGCHENIEDAINARKQAEREHFELIA